MITFTKIKPQRLEKISEFLKLGIVSKHTILAGGAVSALINPELPVNDYDIFFTHSNVDGVLKLDEYKRVKSILEENSFDLIFECPAKELFSYRKGDIKIQLITKSVYYDVGTLLNSFDFHPCMCAYNVDGLHVHSKHVIKCCMKKELDTWYISYPVSSLRRMLKYQKKGFYATNNCLKTIVSNIKSLNLSDENMSFYFD
jgi:hypothetical protein